ncbi:winged helix-turn-helix transcriptional regulator [Capillimicrobium parvum]|uniref:winged helix-turn-helix transcriptional regulator n=1 Tax=Capillimicrobium parvum TaxID=2884022 RepID=UPI00216AF53F|nr:helix-turn-helix domain-containing protein [Capillimicrobium parvum]
MIDDALLSGLTNATSILGDRWSPAIIAALLDGPQRYGELKDRLGIAPNILSARLKALEQEGLVVSTPYSDRPVRLSYALTADARELADLLRLLAAWGAHRTGTPDAITHARCGTPLEVRWWCPTCADTASPGDDESIRL